MLHLPPAPPLRALVRYYAERETQLGAATLIHPVPARASGVLEILLEGRILVRNHPGAPEHSSPGAVLVGLHTCRTRELCLRGTLHSFSIVFQPWGIHQLFQLPMHELTDREHDADAVLGGPVALLKQRLQEAGSPQERANAADAVLLTYLEARRNAQEHRAIYAIAHQLLKDAASHRIDRLALGAGISTRQLERLFREQLGLSPKLFARISRFERALDLKARTPAASWTNIAQITGYYDQMHMVHDFAEFTGQRPGELVLTMERIFAPQLVAARAADREGTRPVPRLFL